MRAPFLGLGTGRCGTTSLANILNNCHRVTCSHESGVYRPVLSGPRLGIDRFVADAQAFASVDELLGDVAFYWTDYAHLVKRNHIPHLKIIVLWRPMQEVVSSFLRRWHGKSRFLAHGHPDFLQPPQANPYWDNVFHHYNTVTAAESIEQHHRETYRAAHAMAAQWPDDVFWLHTRSLNDDSVMETLFDFLDIPQAERHLISDRVHNAGKD